MNGLCLTTAEWQATLTTLVNVLVLVNVAIVVVWNLPGIVFRWLDRRADRRGEVFK